MRRDGPSRRGGFEKIGWVSPARSIRTVQKCGCRVRAASTCHDDFTPGGSGMSNRNFPVFASCTLGRSGAKVAVFEFAGMNRAIGVLAITMKRGGPVAGNGEPVASGV